MKLVALSVFVAAAVGGTVFASGLYGDESQGYYAPYWGHAIGFGLAFAAVVTAVVVVLLRSRLDRRRN
jgi:hypothetical protein